MMASLIETLCCLTHIPACSAVGVVSPSLLELQLLPVNKGCLFHFHFFSFYSDSKAQTTNESGWLIQHTLTPQQVHTPCGEQEQ